MRWMDLARGMEREEAPSSPPILLLNGSGQRKMKHFPGNNKFGHLDRFFLFVFLKRHLFYFIKCTICSTAEFLQTVFSWHARQQASFMSLLLLLLLWDKEWGKFVSLLIQPHDKFLGSSAFAYNKINSFMWIDSGWGAAPTSSNVRQEIIWREFRVNYFVSAPSPKNRMPVYGSVLNLQKGPLQKESSFL